MEECKDSRTGDPNYVSGKNVVVIGRSKIVGSPAAALFMWHHGTTTICHSKTADLKAHCLNADILVVAIGKKHFVKGLRQFSLSLSPGDWVKPGAVVIDCGINVEEATEEGKKNKLFGDVDFEAAKQTAGYITPVPGGVGPMTVAMLIRNTVEQAIRRRITVHEVLLRLQQMSQGDNTHWQIEYLRPHIQSPVPSDIAVSRSQQPKGMLEVSRLLRSLLASAACTRNRNQTKRD